MQEVFSQETDVNLGFVAHPKTRHCSGQDYSNISRAPARCDAQKWAVLHTMEMLKNNRCSPCTPPPIGKWGRAVMLAILLLAFVIACQGWTLAEAQPARFAVVVSGASGGGEYGERFWDWSSKMVASFKGPLQLPDENLFFLAEDPERDPSLVTAQAVKSEFMRVIGELESRVRPNDLLFLLLLGHGNFDGSDYRYNLRGPDLTGAELSAILDRFPTQRIVLVCTTPASGALIPRLSGGNRVILTATKNGYEGNETVFARFFVQSFQNPEVDTDKSRQVSLLEAYTFTHRKVKEWYAEKNQLATEHARLDDNGDGVGSALPEVGSAEGSLAGRVTLAAPAEAAAPAGSPSALTELEALRKKKLDLESSLRELRTRKTILPSDQYREQLEALLVELARTTRAIRERTDR